MVGFLIMTASLGASYYTAVIFMIWMWNFATLIEEVLPRVTTLTRRNTVRNLISGTDLLCCVWFMDSRDRSDIGKWLWHFFTFIMIMIDCFIEVYLNIRYSTDWSSKKTKFVLFSAPVMYFFSTILLFAVKIEERYPLQNMK